MAMVYLEREREGGADREGGRQKRSFGPSRRAVAKEGGGRGAREAGRAERENRFDRFDSHLPDHVAPAYVRTLCIMQAGCMCNA